MPCGIELNGPKINLEWLQGPGGSFPLVPPPWNDFVWEAALSPRRRRCQRLRHLGGRHLLKPPPRVGLQETHYRRRLVPLSGVPRQSANEIYVQDPGGVIRSARNQTLITFPWRTTYVVKITVQRRLFRGDFMEANWCSCLRREDFFANSSSYF